MNTEVRRERESLRSHRSGEIKLSSSSAPKSRLSSASTRPTTNRGSSNTSRIPSFDDAPQVVLPKVVSLSRSKKKSGSFGKECSPVSRSDDPFANFKTCEDLWPGCAVSHICPVMALSVDDNPFRDSLSVPPASVEEIVSTLNLMPPESLSAVLRQLIGINPAHIQTIQSSLTISR